jgi:hypothetical protein
MCADWYEDADCSTEERAKYYVDYTGTATYFNTDGNAIDSFTDTIPVVANGSTINGLIADGIPAYFKRSSSHLLSSSQRIIALRIS